MIQDLGQEFGFSPASGVIVEHVKPRVGGYERHWHALIPEWDPVRRRVLDSKWMRARQEKVARLAELRLAHPMVVGRWNAAVARSLMKEGRLDAANVVGQLAQLPRPAEAYTVQRHQAAARRGVSIPAAQAAAIAAWESAADVRDLLDLIAERGLEVVPGETEGVWLLQVQSQAVVYSSVLVGALHRLLHQPQDTVNCLMASPEIVPPGVA